MNQTAHISLQILSNSKSVETKLNKMRRILLARPASLNSDFRLRCQFLASLSASLRASLLVR